MDKIPFVAYLAACTAIILMPGPAQALTIARSISAGRKSGVLTAIGLNAGTIVHALAAALGLSAVLAASAAAFTVVKWAGAAYLVYLGIRSLRTREAGPAPAGSASSGQWRDFAKALMTGILNPKVALFFLAFLPQFVNPRNGSVLLQFLLLAAVLSVMDIVYESALAFAAGALVRRFAANPGLTAWRHRLTGAVRVALGLRLAFAARD